MEITIHRENNFVINQRPLKVFVDDNFIDFIEPKEKVKKILIDKGGLLQIKVDSRSSNIVNLKEVKNRLELNVVSRIQNGLYVFGFFTFVIGVLLPFLNYISFYLGLILIIPLGCVVYLQNFNKANYLRLTKLSS